MSEAKMVNYRSERGAAAYKRDYETKVHRKVSDRRERAILEQYRQRVGPVESALDLPCGAGRLYGFVADWAKTVVEADFSPTMLKLNRADHDADALGYTECSALAIPFADDAVDLVLSVRLSHHLDRPEDRERHVRELCRVARKAVIFTWFDHDSLKNRLRRLRAPFNKKRAKNTMTMAQVRATAEDSGFSLEVAAPLSRLGSGHRFGLLRRRS